MNRSFLVFNNSLSDLTNLSTISAYEPSNDFDTRTQFLDMETGEHIITEPWLIKANYQQIIDDLKSFYKKECQENSIDYVPIYTDETFDKSLTEYLNKRKKLN